MCITSGQTFRASFTESSLVQRTHPLFRDGLAKHIRDSHKVSTLIKSRRTYPRLKTISTSVSEILTQSRRTHLRLSRISTVTGLSALSELDTDTLLMEEVPPLSAPWSTTFAAIFGVSLIHLVFSVGGFISRRHKYPLTGHCLTLCLIFTVSVLCLYQGGEARPQEHSSGSYGVSCILILYSRLLRALREETGDTIGIVFTLRGLRGRPKAFFHETFFER